MVSWKCLARECWSTTRGIGSIVMVGGGMILRQVDKCGHRRPGDWESAVFLVCVMLAPTFLNNSTVSTRAAAVGLGLFSWVVALLSLPPTAPTAPAAATDALSLFRTAAKKLFLATDLLVVL